MAFYLFKGAKMNNRISKIVLITLATVAAVLVFIRPSVSRGESMANPDLGTYDNDLEIDISVNAHIFKPQRGDVVQTSNGLNKRVIGLPGETILIYREQVYINGELLDEPYAYFDPDKWDPYRTIKNITLGEDEYFLMGDNRRNSTDSREYYSYFANDERNRTGRVGKITGSMIESKTIMVLFGLDSEDVPILDKVVEKAIELNEKSFRYFRDLKLS